MLLSLFLMEIEITFLLKRNPNWWSRNKKWNLLTIVLISFRNKLIYAQRLDFENAHQGHVEDSKPKSRNWPHPSRISPDCTSHGKSLLDRREGFVIENRRMTWKTSMWTQLQGIFMSVTLWTRLFFELTIRQESIFEVCGAITSDSCEVDQRTDGDYSIVHDYYSHRNNFERFRVFLELMKRFKFDLSLRNFFWWFEFLMCSGFNHMQWDSTCACAVACLHPHNSISNVVVSLTIHDNTFIKVYFLFGTLLWS